MSFLRRFWGDRRGVIAVVFGLLLPVVIFGGAAAIEYAHLAHAKAVLQRATDLAAITATKELALANVDDQRVASVARDAVLAALDDPASVTVTSEILNKRSSLRVNVTQTVPSWIGRLLTLPSMQLNTSAMASMSGATRLCILALDPSSNSTLQMDKAARVSAGQCSVFSNSTSPRGLISKDNALLTAERICTGGGFLGTAGANYSQAPLTDCPLRDDPLASRPMPNVGGCDYINLVVSGQTRTLNPGVYCGGLKVTNGAQVTLAQGTYVMDGGPLTVNGASTLQGDYVGIFLSGTGATFNFSQDTTISLSAPKVGSMAGILFFEDRSAPLMRNFVISSDNARRLIGTIYLPRGQLRVDANKPVADQSAYTVIVARQLWLTGAPNLVMNAMYTQTDVPVPAGIGPVGASITLSQ